MKSFKQIAKTNHISRQTIYNRIDTMPGFKSKHMKKHNQKWMVDDAGVRLLNLPKKRARPKHYKRHAGPVKKDYIDEVYDLRKQLRQKDHVIANLSTSFKTLAHHTEIGYTGYHRHGSVKPHQPYLIATDERKIKSYRRHGRWYRFFHNIK